MTGAVGGEGIVSIVIVGGGYAGMIAANRLLGSLNREERERVRVRIVNPTDRFVHRIRLHEHAAGIADASLDLRSMIHAETAVVLGTGAQIEPNAQVLHVHTVTGEQQLAYDWLIYAVGSHGASQTPGVSEFAVPIADVDGAAETARRMNTKDVRSVCVVGGGPAGVETAAELAEAHPATTVTLIAGSELVSAMPPAARKSIRRRLQRRGVTVLDSLHVLKVTPRGVHTDDGVSREFDLVVWAAGFEVPELAARSGLPVDSIGRLLVDDTLQCVADAHILGAGDAVKPPDTVSAHLPMGARTALPMGGAAAETLLAHLRHQNPRPISIGLLGPSISLGRRDGYIQLAYPDDTPTRIAVTGRAGAAIKRWVCRMTIDSPRREREHPGAYRVPRGPARI